MTEVALVACAKTKAKHGGPAASLYISPLYRKSLLAALDRSKSVYIVSAKYGLLELGTTVEPYEKTLKTMGKIERAEWADNVSRQLASRIKRGDRAILYCGDDYFGPLRAPLLGLGVVPERPLGTRSLGTRLQYLRELNAESELERDLSRFSVLLRRLVKAQGGGRPIRECSGRMTWPERGVYLVLEDIMSAGRPLVTRVGTHAVSMGSKTTLWDRISTHRGATHGGGSHRSSIFRAHVGRALMRRGDLDGERFQTWGVGQSADAKTRVAEEELERQVSKIIGDMRMLWLDIPDDPGPRSDRAFIERNLIGLLSRMNVLRPQSPPHPHWLGHWSEDWRIALGGLWNLDHLFYRPDPGFLDVFESYIDSTIGRVPRPTGSIAPANWGRGGGSDARQLGLFGGR